MLFSSLVCIQERIVKICREELAILSDKRNRKKFSKIQEKNLNGKFSIINMVTIDFLFVPVLMKQWRKLKDETQELLHQCLELKKIRASMDGVKYESLNISEAFDKIGEDALTGLEKCEVG